VPALWGISNIKRWRNLQKIRATVLQQWDDLLGEFRPFEDQNSSGYEHHNKALDIYPGPYWEKEFGGLDCNEKDEVEQKISI
jgi:hypothetical protein